MKYDFIPSRLARIKVCLTKPIIVETVEQWKFLYSAANDVNSTITLESNLAISGKKQGCPTLTTLKITNL